MQIKKIGAKAVFDSRRKKTIQVILKTSAGKFKTSAPSGKSKGKYEIPSYKKSLEEDIDFINNIDINKLNRIINKNLVKRINLNKAFSILREIEELVKNKIGGNSLFALEACLLKALSREKGVELWEFLYKGNKDKIKFPRPIGNAIGGGLHSKGRGGKKPDFQEFLFIANGRTFEENVKINKLAYNLTGKFLGYWIKKRNDECAFETGLSNEKVLNIMQYIKKIINQKYKKDVDIGLDAASSSFFDKEFYYYKNPPKKLDAEGQIDYIKYLIEKYDLFYAEDAFEENDFESFARLKNKTHNCFIVGDDLTATNPERVKKAIKMNSISGIIIKPNQIGSLIKLKRVIELAKKHNIKTIISHRSGETIDDTIADLAIGFQCDFIKTGIYGKVRRAKLKRLMKIEREQNNYYSSSPVKS